MASTVIIGAVQGSSQGYRTFAPPLRDAASPRPSRPSSLLSQDDSIERALAEAVANAQAQTAIQDQLQAQMAQQEPPPRFAARPLWRRAMESVLACFFCE